MHDRHRASPCRPSRWWARASQDDQLERKIRRFRNNAWEILEKNKGPMPYPEFITALRNFDYVEMDMKVRPILNISTSTKTRGGLGRGFLVIMSRARASAPRE